MAMGIFYSLHILSCYLMVLLMLEEFIQFDLSSQFPVELLRSASHVEMFPCQNSEGLKELHGGSHKNCHQMNDDSFQLKFNQSSKEYQPAFDFRLCSPTQDISGCNLQKICKFKRKNEHVSCILYHHVIPDPIVFVP